MRIERENRDHVGSVWAVFTPEELRQLLDHLTYYFDDDEPRHEWHAHIGQRPDNELTITVEEADG